MFKSKKESIYAEPYIMPSLDLEPFEPQQQEDLAQSTEQTPEKLLNSLKIEEIEREAYEKGYEAGQKAGFEMGEQKAMLLIQRLEKMLLDLGELRKRELMQLEKQVLQLSLTIAKKIILKEISVNPEILVHIVKEALLKLQRAGQIVIKIHPTLHEIFIKNNSTLLNISSDLIFEVDSKAPIFGATIIGPEETIITDIEEQFKIISDEIGV
ncbi:MAG: FliH/SctL family protein [Thermodesulfovibrionales bacterium]|nr:FliH/SctL family protein [Thermodesulfovibrionales bacterium]